MAVCNRQKKHLAVIFLHGVGHLNWLLVLTEIFLAKDLLYLDDALQLTDSALGYACTASIAVLLARVENSVPAKNTLFSGNNSVFFGVGRSAVFKRCNTSPNKLHSGTPCWIGDRSRC